MMKVIVAKGFNDAEYDAIKKELKKLGVKLSVRRWKRNYAPNAIDIRPMKAQDYVFTREQIDKIYDYLVNYGNIIIHGRPIEYYYERRHLYFDRGFNFVMQRETR